MTETAQISESSGAAGLREQVRRACQAYRRTRAATVWEHLLAEVGASDEESARALAQRLQSLLRMPVLLLPVPLERTTSAEPGLRALEGVAGAVQLPDGRVGVADPWDPPTQQAVEARLGASARCVLASNDWLSAFRAGARAPDAPPGAAAEGPTLAEGAVVAYVDRVLRDAFLQGASDIHIEVSREGAVAKLRLDGVLVEHSRLAGLGRAEEAVSRIKVLAKLDITERRIPQDGRLTFDAGGRSLDLRVSVMPSIFAEDAVLRLLDKAQLRGQSGAVSLEVLGFGADSEARLRALSELPHGMTLVTGPTGSGKTTTVYAVLSEVSTGREKIITIEDPVEYELPGVLQIPVNERKGLTFAKGLRSILRHDPDRILVGEIRDAETAEIAVQSALTGHQVFTTVHANSIFDVTGRFRHFGLDMFGFMSSLNGVVVQRLVRRTCATCSRRGSAGDAAGAWLRSQGAGDEGALSLVHRGVGCAECRATGFKGRLVIAEVHAIDDTLRDLVTTQAPLSRLKAHIAGSGVSSLAQSAVQLVLAGLTTPEEVKRVLGWSASHA